LVRHEPIGAVSAPTPLTLDHATLAPVDRPDLAKARLLALLRVGPWTIIGVMAIAWASVFGYLSVVRHLALGSHAEDLGFTDQVVWNFLRGQWFRMSVYNGATWNTELDLSRMVRPDSLFAFHFEPMLLTFVPLYALGGGAVALLVIQAIALASGALPLFSLARHLSRSKWCGVAVAAAYLLSPLGQWAVLDDFHTSSLAAPLLLLSLERLIVARAPRQALVCAAVAASAREDVGPVLVCLGAAMLVRRRNPTWTGAAYLGLGATSTVLALLVIRSYSGGLSLLESRYTLALGLAPLARPIVQQYAATLLLSGGWLGLFAPFALVPALPIIGLNGLSSSAWMGSGQAHYSALALPFVALGAAAGLSRLRPHVRLQHAAALALVATSGVAYFLAGAGPLGANYAPARITERAQRALSVAEQLPSAAAVSASSDLLPHLTHRARAYVFPTLLDADYVYLDLQSSPAPTSAGDVYLRVQSLLDSGEWHIADQADGLLLLEHSSPEAGGLPSSLAPLVAAPQPAAFTATGVARPSAAQSRVTPRLVSAALMPSPDGAIDVDGPRWILRTVWQSDQPQPAGTRLEFSINLRSGEQLHVWDIAALWWNPPELWPTGQPVTIDVPDVPRREFVSWSAMWSSDP
jgi:uncharacterized membrane protein